MTGSMIAAISDWNAPSTPIQVTALSTGKCSAINIRFASFGAVINMFVHAPPILPELLIYRNANWDLKEDIKYFVKPASEIESGANTSSTSVAFADSEEHPILSRRELWSYYVYYSGDNSVGPLSFMLTLFQSLTFAAGFDSASGPGNSCKTLGPSSKCVVPWLGGTMTVSGAVMIANGVSFGIMAILFVMLNSAADYGNNGKWMLLGCSIICWASQFAAMSLLNPSRWPVAMILFMISFISYGATVPLYFAAFPRLARNSPHTRSVRRKYENGEITREEYEREESLQKNRLSNMSGVFSNLGQLVMLCLNLTLLLPLKDDPRVNNYVIVLLTTFSLLTGIWWFIFQQPRPGPPTPKGSHFLTIGWKQVWKACTQCRKLPHTFVYLLAVNILTGGTNSTVTLVQICQNDKVSFGFLENTYFGLAGALSAVISIFVYWRIQKYFKIATKKMFVVTTVWTIVVPLWGMVGIWTPKFGFHNVWEFWLYNIGFGMFQAPLYALLQTMMAELSPPGFDYVFFGLLGLSVTCSSMFDPIILTAIINRSGSNWIGFPFLFSLCLLASLIIWFGVDVQKGRRDAFAWAQAARAAQ